MSNTPTVPPEVAEARRSMCRRCPRPCKHQKDAAWHATACAACPLSRREYREAWPFMPGCVEAVASPDTRGLGDVVHSAAKPVVAIVRAVTGGRIDLADCTSCNGPGGRRERWNAAVPFRRPPPV